VPRESVTAIVAEMVANVIEISVEVGSTVASGDAVVLLESMKMEIPVLTEHGGTVVSVAVKEGDVVQGGDLIAVVERAPEGEE
jgi:acetyl-CoA carboxylase biotin carboxyl carrier protein